MVLTTEKILLEASQESSMSATSTSLGLSHLAKYMKILRFPSVLKVFTLFVYSGCEGA